MEREGLISSGVGFVAERLRFATMSKSLPSEGKGRFERVGTAEADTVRCSSTEGAETEETAGGRVGVKVGVCGCGCGCCRLLSGTGGKTNEEGECDKGRCRREDSE